VEIDGFLCFNKFDAQVVDFVSNRMNLSHLHFIERWKFLTISTKEASAQKKAVSFYSMNASEAFFMGPVSNIGITPMGRSNPSTTSCLRNP
jgi:hypothetical protein